MPAHGISGELQSCASSPRTHAAAHEDRRLHLVVCLWRCRVRTNIVLDDNLVREAARLTGIRTKRSLVDEALRLLVKTKKRRSILALKGKIRFADGYDHKALRGRDLDPR